MSDFASPADFDDIAGGRREVLGALVVLLCALAALLVAGCAFVAWGQLGIHRDLAAQATRGYESRAITCIVVTHDKANADKPVPSQCLDPHVLAFVPAEYRYAK